MAKIGIMMHCFSCVILDIETGSLVAYQISCQAVISPKTVTIDFLSLVNASASWAHIISHIMWHSILRQLHFYVHICANLYFIFS